MIEILRKTGNKETRELIGENDWRHGDKFRCRNDKSIFCIRRRITDRNGNLRITAWERDRVLNLISGEKDLFWDRG